MSRRRPSRNHDSSVAATPRASRTQVGWLGRLLNRATSAGLAGNGGVRYGMESLESRTMLTTLSDPGTDALNPSQFNYWSAEGQIIRISYFDVTFEAVGIQSDPTTGAATLGDLAPATLVPGAAQPVHGTDLFQVYVTQSHPDSFISVYTIDVTPTAIVPTPLTGSIRQIAVTSTTGTPHTTAIPGGTGGVLIGGLDTVSVPGPTPIDTVGGFTGLGIEPDPGAPNILTAGIDVIPVNTVTGAPNDFGNFLVGGTVTGMVSFGGNVNLFYAGAVLTGNIQGGTINQIDDTDIGTGSIITTTGATSARPVPNNFYVAGDLRGFITAGPVGTDDTGTASTPQYITDFDLSVGGKLGEVHVGNTENGVAVANFDGTIEAGNSPLISYQTAYSNPLPSDLLGNLADQTEWEVVPPNTPLGPNEPFEDGELTLRNDRIADAQILSSIPVLDPVTGLPTRDVDGNIIYQASVDGTTSINPADPADYYAVPMLAGTTFSVTISDGITLAVYDPDGRVIGSNVRSGVGPQQFTADRPGLYRFQVSASINGTSVLGPYNLTISNVGNMGIGGIVVTGDMNDVGIDTSIISGNGDLGVIDVGGTYVSKTLGPTPATPDPLAPIGTVIPLVSPTTILVAAGSLRALIASSIGATVNGVIVFGPYLSVPNGSVGLVRATGTVPGDVLDLFTQFDPNALETDVFKTDDLYASAIGGEIQVIDAALTLFCEIGTNKGIGSIHAQNMATTVASYIDVNADNLNDDGVIDLIDVTGSFGILGLGPQIVTHDGGNVRYLDLGGPIFLPEQFGGEQDLPVTYAAGASQTLTDDSGATYSVTANGPTVSTSVTNAAGVTSIQVTGPQVTSVTYPVLDKAGEIPVSLSSTGSLTVNALSSGGGNATVDIGSVTFTGVGRPIVSSGATNASTGTTTTTTTTGVDANGNTSISQPVPAGGEAGVVVGPMTDATDEFLSLTGTTSINVLNTTATSSVAGNSPVEISNVTRGEMVNVNLPDGIGTLIANGNLGFGTGVASPVQIMPDAIVTNGNVYPFLQQHTTVIIGTGFETGGSPGGGPSSGTTGDAVSIQVGGAVGNVQAGGTIQSLVADSARSTGHFSAPTITGQLNGIVGPILGTRLLYIDVGQGLLPSGTGSVGFAGIYATGKVGTVTNSGNDNGDIRGDILSAEDDSTGIAIDAIDVFNASIIGSDVITIEDSPAHVPQFFEVSPTIGGGIVNPSNGTNFAPNAGPYVYDVGPITVTGDGGILGAAFEANSFASFTVNGGGFGIFTSLINGQPNGRIGSISASGYGIRDTNVENAGYLGAVTATGNGSLIPVTRYPVDVRPSDVPNLLDPFFGITPDKTIDINDLLGTTAAITNIPNVTDTGVIEDDIFNGARDFTSLTAQKSRTAHPLFTPGLINPLPSTADVPTQGNVFSNSITFGGLMGSINIKQVTDGFQVTVGQLGTLSLGNDVNRVGIAVAGNMKSLVVHGNLGQYITDPATGTLVPDSYINAGGANGTITSLKVFGNLNANVYATGSIGSVLVTGDLLGSITSFAHTVGYALASLRVFGGIRDGALVLNGNVGSIIVNGTLGTSAGSLNIVGSVQLISVGANHRQKGSNLALALTVNGTLKKLLVNGKITGSVHTIGDLTTLQVTGDGTTPNIITGNLTIDGRLGTARITNGNIASNIIANGSITNFTLNRGSVLSSSTIQSQIDAIHSFNIVGGLNYGLYGSLLAGAGLNDSINISGNMGDTIDPALITADSGTTFSFGGSIQNHATITVTNALNLLAVNGNVAAGATISAHPLKATRIKGTNAGTITII